MNYLILVGMLVATVATYFGVKIKAGEEARVKLVKILSLVLFGAYFVRYWSYNSTLPGVTLAVKSFSPLLPTKLSAGQAFMAFAGEWLTMTAMLLLTVKPFFSVKTLDRLTVFFTPVLCVINAAFFSFMLTESVGVDAGRIGFVSAVIAVELGLSLALSAIHIYEALKNRESVAFKGYKSVLVFVAAAVCCIACTMPNYALSFLFGDIAVKAIKIKGFELYHRLLIYGAIALPLLIYFAIRHQSKAVIKAVMVYFSLAMMMLYCYNRTFVQLVTNPADWPLHLCNTAMFLVPICLIFKTEKLFYFTYFINVFGALIAMLMPNYGDSSYVFSSQITNFWYNHYPAFFMPLLAVALKIFDRPTVRQFRYSIIGFLMYFAVALLMNVILKGFGFNPDYFFLSGKHIVDTLGTWVEKLYEVEAVIAIGGREFLFRPVYQALFFIVYVCLGLSMWFVYELGFSFADSSGALTERRKKQRQDQIALMSVLDGRSIEEPMNADAGVKLELKNFSKKYSTSKQYAVKNANLEVYGGEIFGFLGPNGAGKSTIIKSIVGIQPITEGAIEVCGYDCEKQPVQAKRLIGYVPDHYALYEKLTGREYINYIADIYGVSKEDRTERIERHIEMFELAGAIDNPIKTYSHGMKQKITIMAALVHDPKLWILDEPLTGLDPNSIHQVKECMKEHAARGNIVFFSSHIIDVVERICDRITIIKKGQILVTKDVKDIEREGLLEDFYLRTIGGEGEAEKK